MTIDELNALYEATDFGNNANYKAPSFDGEFKEKILPVDTSIPGLPIVQQLGKPYDDNDGGIKALAGMDYGYDSVFDNTNITPIMPNGEEQPQTNFEYDIEEGSIPQSDIDNLENAKNDTNVNNLINMGLVDKAKNYVKNNYGYMIMNLIFPGSGIVAKDVIERKNKREDAARRVEEENILLDKQNALIASKEAEEAAFQATLNQQQERQRRADLERIERAYRQDTGSGGGSYATGESGQQSDGSYNDPFDPGGGEKDGGHIDGTNRRRYGMGGIVSL
jgi:hypothetical protein